MRFNQEKERERKQSDHASLLSRKVKRERHARLASDARHEVSSWCCRQEAVTELLLFRLEVSSPEARRLSGGQCGSPAARMRRESDGSSTRRIMIKITHECERVRKKEKKSARHASTVSPFAQILCLTKETRVDFD